eukprot:scaffold4883_cov119-Isochrysis_galbana.AAC.6
MAKWELDCTRRNVPCNVEIKTPHTPLDDHTTRAHRHTVPGHLPPPVRLGLGGHRRQGILFLPSGARGGSPRLPSALGLSGACGVAA